MAGKSRNDRGGYNRGLKGREYARVISISQVKAKKLKGKPRCPVCGNVLMFVYDEASRGHTDQKCLRCNAKVWVDLDTMECIQIVDDDSGAAGGRTETRNVAVS
ncbi:MAG: hypothetical protein LIP11_16065 [Clostridiales bacterium]|nr:hypothetical protein [Clostridiales bacterium]